MRRVPFLLLASLLCACPVAGDDDDTPPPYEGPPEWGAWRVTLNAEPQDSCSRELDVGAGDDITNTDVEEAGEDGGDFTMRESFDTWAVGGGLHEFVCFMDGGGAFTCEAFLSSFDPDIPAPFQTQVVRTGTLLSPSEATFLTSYEENCVASSEACATAEEIYGVEYPCLSSFAADATLR
ncbi:MAG: hypothetical protein KDA24_08510 [Deltaproteobacteria bacterium]|nr:hypothetical protein [Deltaproteobacteria bacterium]